MSKYELVGYNSNRIHEAVASVGGRILSHRSVWETHFGDEYGFGSGGRYRYHFVVESPLPVPEFDLQALPPKLLQE